MKSKKNNKKSIRLDSYIRPEKYSLTLKPDLESFTFGGSEEIEIILDKNIKEVTLHAKDIDISTVEISQNKKTQFAQKISYDIKTETATFKFKNEIKKGKAKLFLVFSGIINDNLRGFYKSRYVVDGKEKNLATTQFESTDARRAFPCFDEPAQKATFDISLIIPKNQTAISNTLPVSVREHESGYKVVEFSSTPRMSTYLLAFIIGEFEYIEGYTKDKVQVRVFTTKGKKHQAKFALDVAIRSLEFYNKYFDIPYPLPILDLIAIPDFESAAMENWGAVTFRETAILVDEKNSSLSNKQWVAIVIAHEIAHQWFGNLVTMHWWTDLWLNEGFASYMENLCVDHLFKEWRTWELYLADRYAVALRLDSLSNSHPIEVEVHHPDEISEIFDMVSYAKGSAVIRMVAEYLGFEKFRDGLRHYLKKHSYKNTKTLDLWDSLEHVSKKPVKKLMNNWTKKTGYPLVTLSKINKGYKINQERFFSSRVSRKASKNNTIWDIPIKYEKNKSILLTNKSIILQDNSIGKINSGEGSFIRTRYDKDTLAKLGIEVRNKTLPVGDRLGLARDVFALAEGGYIPTAEALSFSLNYKNETEYIVWSELSAGINRVYRLIRNEKWSQNYKKYALSLFSHLAEKMTFERKKGENHSDVFLRNLAIANAASYGNNNVIRKARELFNNRLANPISPDIRTTIYGIVALDGGMKEYEQFIKLYKKEQFQEEKDRYSYALTRFKDKNLLSKTLKFAISKEVRAQDTPFIIAQVWQNINGRDLTWKFIKSNWSEILKRYGDGGMISRLIKQLENHITKADLQDAKKFFKKNIAPGSERTLEQVYERISSNITWLNSDKNSIKNWLDQNFS